MSLSNTEREMLLSAALDGELSSDEKLEFDRAFAADDSFANEFLQLQTLSAELRGSLADLRQQKLSPVAAQRIATAVAAAMLPANATLQPASLNSATNSGRVKKRFGQVTWISTALGLAASLMIAVNLVLHQFGQPD